jgi:tetratricopeptide (TPR) repeat protein
MRKFIIVALVLVAVGVGVSLYLIPNSGDIAVMQAHDVQNVDLGAVDVEGEYNAGRRSFPIISGLADKRVNEGNRPAAITLLEEYVTANPNDVQGRKKLAEQYQLAGDNAKYNEQLEAIANAEPTEANLRVLSDVYNADKNYPKQVEVLKKILEVTKGEKPEVFVDLATIQVVVGDNDDALATIEQLKAKHPAYENYAVVRIQVNVLAEKGEIDKAYDIANAWVSRPIPAQLDQGVPPQVTPPSGEISSPASPSGIRAKELADLCNILHYSGHPDKAVALVEPRIELLEQSTELVVAYVNANITLGRDEHAYTILTKIDEAGKMTPELYHPYLQLAIKREDMEAAQGIAQKLDPATFSEEQALNIIELARSLEAKPVLDILLTRFEEPAIVENKPVLAAVISILKNEKEQDAKVDVALNTELSTFQRLRLAEACVRANKTACFETLVSRFPPVPEQTTPQIAEYSQLYIIADRAKEVIGPVGARATVENAHPDIVWSHVKLAAASQHDEITKPWLEVNANSTPLIKMHELFYTASDHHSPAIASDIAERLYARDPSPMNREIMISALINSGQDEKALPLLREQLAENGSNDGLYVATLSKVARKNADARKELADYAQASLQSGRGDEKQQINYAYVLLNNGRKDVAMPYIRDNAKTKGGEWKKMQYQLTNNAKAGPAIRLTREQRVAMANNPKISDVNKRQIAFSLQKDGYKDDATKIFQSLAETKGPDSQEVKDLLYMWGGKLNTQQIAWLQTRAANANAYDKQKWGNLINVYGDDQAVMQYVSATPDALYNPSLRQKYFRVLATSGNRDNYDGRMRDWVAQTTDVPALSDYAKTAAAYGYKDASINAYRRIESLDPQNEQALTALAAQAMDKGSYSNASQYVDRTIAVQSATAQPATDPAQAHFYKAELLKREGNIPAAQQEYTQVVQYSANTTAPDALSRKYTAMFQLGQHQQAMQGFESLLAARPDDKGVLADYMSALIEFKYFEDATRIANQYDKTSPYYGRTSAIHGQSQEVSSIQRFSDGREMKISFAKAIEDSAPVDIAAVKNLGWVEHASMDYDSISISAKPGYVVRFVPTAQEQFAVVPAPVETVSPSIEAQRAQELRLQLLYAQIEQQTGQSDKAQQRLAVLRQYYPNEPQLIAQTASVQAAEGNTSEAIETYQVAQSLAPENEDYQRIIRDLRNGGGGGGSYGGRSTIAQYIKLDHEYRNYGANHEHITTLSGVARVGDRDEVGFNLMNDHVNPKGFLDPATGVATRDSDNFQAGELFIGHYLDNGDRLQASLFANEDTAGAGAYYAFGNSLGRTELLGEYRKPYWDFPEAVYGLTSRDRVGVKHYGMINPTLSYGIETSLNNYNVEVKDSVAQTGLFRLNLEQRLQPLTDSQPYFGVSYGFDGEYMIDNKDRLINGTGPGTYRPFPMQTREIHQVAGIYRDNWTDSTHVMLLGGYLVDRYGENGPVVEGRLNQDLTDALEVGVRGRYGLAASANGSTAEDDAVNLGADIMYKF